MILQAVSAIDSHTAGEPTRVVTAGGPDLGNGTPAERLEVFRTRFDSFRSAVVHEPRGSDVLVGALLHEPRDPTCAAGVIFFNNVGFLGMCGHGTIGVVATLAHLGRLRPGRHFLETPVGRVAVELFEDGRVALTNVPSRRVAAGVTLDVPGLGPVTGDIAWGGNWFFLADLAQPSLSHVVPAEPTLPAAKVPQQGAIASQVSSCAVVAERKSNGPAAPADRVENGPASTRAIASPAVPATSLAAPTANGFPPAAERLPSGPIASQIVSSAAVADRSAAAAESDPTGPLELTLAHVPRLTDLALRIRKALNRGGYSEVDHVELFGPAMMMGGDARNFVLCPGNAYDRSPCGTGTSAKLACLAASGKLPPGREWVQESILGTRFVGSYVWADAPGGPILPTLIGTAYLTAEIRLLFDPHDPFVAGIRPG